MFLGNFSYIFYARINQLKQNFEHILRIHFISDSYLYLKDKQEILRSAFILRLRNKRTICNV